MARVEFPNIFTVKGKEEDEEQTSVIQSYRHNYKILDLPDAVIQFEICGYLTHKENHRFLTTNKQHFRSLKEKAVVFSCASDNMLLARQSGVLQDRNVDFWMNVLPENNIEDALNHGMRIQRCNFNLGDDEYDYTRWREFINCCKDKDICKDLTTNNQSLRTQFPEFSFFIHPLFTSNLHTLSLTGVPLTTVSTFASIRNLELICIEDLQSITNIGHKKSLVIEDCYELTDIRISEPIETLSVSECNCLTEIEGLHYVKHIRLKEGTSLHNLSGFACRDVDKLFVFPGETSESFNDRLKELKKVNRINSLCFEVDDELLSSIKHNKKWCEDVIRSHRLQHLKITSPIQTILDVKNCYLNQLFCLTLSSLDMKKLDGRVVGNIRILEIHHCYNLKSLIGEFHNYSLSITYCDKLTVVNMLNEVKRLTIKRCSMLSYVSTLGKVPYLNLSYCSEVQDVTGLGKGNVTLILRGTAVEEVSHLTTVQTLDLRDCSIECIIDAEQLVGFVPNLILK